MTPMKGGPPTTPGGMQPNNGLSNTQRQVSDETGLMQNYAIFMELKLGSSGFPAIKINVVCQVRIGVLLIVPACIGVCTPWQTGKMPHRSACDERLCKHIFLAFVFRLCGQQMPKDHQIEPHGLWCHSMGHYGRSGISEVYLWMGAIFMKISTLLLWNPPSVFHTGSINFKSNLDQIYQTYQWCASIIFWGCKGARKF